MQRNAHPSPDGSQFTPWRWWMVVSGISVIIGCLWYASAPDEITTTPMRDPSRSAPTGNRPAWVQQPSGAHSHEPRLLRLPETVGALSASSKPGDLSNLAKRQGIELCGWFYGPDAAPPQGMGPTVPVATEPEMGMMAISPAIPAAFQHGPGCFCAGCRQCAPPRIVTGVDSHACVPCGEPTWSMRGPIPWEMFAQGEYLGPHRDPHVDEYRLRVDDELEFVFRLTRERSARPYQLAVGDVVRVESIADEKLNRDLEVQPDGSITLPLAGQLMAAGRTADEIRRDLETRFKKFYKDPTITVTPIRMNTKLEDLRATVDSRQGQGGQSRIARITPDGTVSLPAVGPLPAHGLTLREFQQEINARYASMFDGIEVIPVLSQKAPHFVYVAGDVAQPGRHEMFGPTTVIQAIALAQGPNVGANLRQIVIFRRASDWRLLATKVDVRGAMYGQRPAPSDELWLRDSDIVIVPKSPLKTTTDALSLIFTDGVYAVAPFLTNGFFFANGSTILSAN